MKSRAFPRQKAEAWVKASALNRMTNLGMPISVKILSGERNRAPSAQFRFIQQRRTDCQIFSSVCHLSVTLAVVF
jgi:hypothetical protein